MPQKLKFHKNKFEKKLKTGKKATIMLAINCINDCNHFGNTTRVSLGLKSQHQSK